MPRKYSFGGRGCMGWGGGGWKGGGNFFISLSWVLHLPWGSPESLIRLWFNDSGVIMTSKCQPNLTVIVSKLFTEPQDATPASCPPFSPPPPPYLGALSFSQFSDRWSAIIILVKDVICCSTEMGFILFYPLSMLYTTHSLKLSLKSPTRLQLPGNVSLQSRCCASCDR